MDDTAARAPRRSWTRWLIGIALMGAAVALIVVRWGPALWSTPSGGGRGGAGGPAVTAPSLPRRGEIHVASSLEHRGAVPINAGELAGSNVLIVTFDTTRADRIGCYGYDAARTPTLDQLSREGVLFSSVAAPAPTTLPSHASLMTGLYPFHHGARANGLFRLDDAHRTLAEILTDEGYATGAMVSASVLESQFGLSQGFDVYDDDLTRHLDDDPPDAVGGVHGAKPERRADQTTQRAESWLRVHAGDPFFLWVHFYDPHFPYEAPDPDGALPYDAEIAFADTQLARLVQLLDELNLTEKTLVVVAGDHGEGLGQHGESTHACLIYESTMHVPMIMRHGREGLGGGVHLDRLVSLVDVTPTLLSMLGVDVPEGLDGVDLTRPASGPRYVYMETLQGLADYGWAALLGVRDDTTKYIFGPTDELYDLRRDPFEEDDVRDARPEIASAMREQLTAFFGHDLDDATSADPTHELDPAALARLQALGYLGDVGASAPSTAAERPHPKDALPLQSLILAAQQVEHSADLDASIERLEEIVAEHPDSYSGRLALGRAYLKRGSASEAEGEFASCHQSHPDRWEPLLSLARLCRAQGRDDEAVDLCRLALASNPSNPIVLKELGGTLLQRGDSEEAAELLIRGLGIWPHDDDLPDMVVDALLALEREPDAMRLLLEVIETGSDAPMVRNAVARLLMGRGQCVDAVAALREGVELAPREHVMVNNLALSIVGCGDASVQHPLEAAVLMERARFETDYRDPRYLQTLALVYSMQLRAREAIAVVERARVVAADPERPEFASMLPGIDESIAGYRALETQVHDLLIQSKDPGAQEVQP